MLMLVIGAFGKEASLKVVTLLGAVALVLSMALVWQQNGALELHFKDMFRIDAFTRFSKLLILLAGLFALSLSSQWSLSPEQRKFEFPILMLLSIAGLMLMVSANDFLALYMALELSSLALYVMAAFDRDNARSSEAGLKYFILGALASGMLLFGVSLVYGFSGTTNFALLAQLLGAEDYQLTAGLAVGLVLILVGLCFKISAVPFHMWTPDVYEGAPTPVVAFFAVAPKVGAIILLTRLLHQPFADLDAHWQPIILLVSVLSMLLGAFGALRQTDLKRLLAYSSIGHVGYMLIGVLVGGAQGMQSVLIYLSLYLFMSVGAFGFVLSLRREGRMITHISELGGLSQTSPRLAIFMALIMFSMAGIPPLAGFFAKFYVFKAAIEAEYYVLAVLGLFASVVAAYYYLKIVKIMFFDEARPAFDRYVLPMHSRAILMLCALVTGFYFLSPMALLEMSQNAVNLLSM